ncbi:hypothetical protein TNIN_153861 [Trichonephila inaurata madagascariensis]|uniref:Uncharacterized protein n=1 Tax=Trichonephila inaurata madagascariensis TaxID=2747483 RepID=A0A8X7CD65_9ARAC|nr:hypothetical protein TNIN_153861 [Trichonephila inaurata madagascariensis]
MLQTFGRILAFMVVGKGLGIIIDVLSGLVLTLVLSKTEVRIRAVTGRDMGAGHSGKFHIYDKKDMRMECDANLMELLEPWRCMLLHHYEETVN